VTQREGGHSLGGGERRGSLFLKPEKNAEKVPCKKEKVRILSEGFLREIDEQSFI